MRAIGIDLGTTNSCIAVINPVVTDVEKVIVIEDDHNRNITPSVVSDDGGNIVVGHSAKQLMAENAGCNIHSFVKRAMGSNKTYLLNGKDYLPEEVSAEILKHLKSLAENKLKTKIDRAVITVPAYFNNEQKLSTKKAAELAGFDIQMDDILIEPIAAGLFYCYINNTPQMRILCFDLGGGTFDVTIMEKKNGEINQIKFGGDHFLGGCDFDRLLTDFFIKHLRKGFEIEFNGKDPGAEANYNKLLYIAEKTKVKLSEEVECKIVQRELFKDGKGEMAELVMTVTRKQFEELIKESVEKTVNETLRVIKAAGMKPEDIDKVIMVGGSSRIPIVQRALEEALGKVPELIDADTCVAKGAAIKASSLVGEVAEGIKFDPFPETTNDEAIDISGQVEKNKPEFSSAAKIKLERADAGYRETAELTDTGGFYFEEVQLAEDVVNKFEVSLLDEKGNVLTKHSFNIRHTADEQEGGVLASEVDISGACNVISRDISVQFVDGLTTMVTAGTKLPYRIMKPRQTTDQAGKIMIPVFEEVTEIGCLEITNLPTDLPIGTNVDVSLEFKPDFTVDVNAKIAALDLDRSCNIKLSKVDVRSISDMKEDFEGLIDLYDQKVANIEDRNEKMEFRAKVEKKISDVRNCFDATVPDDVKIANMLLELKSMIKLAPTKPVGLQPSYKDFKTKLSKALNLMEEKRKIDSSALAHRDSIENISKEAELVFEKNDKYKWSVMNQALDSIINDLEQIGADEKPSLSDIDPRESAPILKDYALQECDKLAAVARSKGKLSEIEGELKALKRQFENIDVMSDPKNALYDILDLFRTRFTVLQNKVGYEGGPSKDGLL